MDTLQIYINTKEISRLLINVQEIKMLSFFQGNYLAYAWKIYHGRFALLFSLKYEETCIYNT